MRPTQKLLLWALALLVFAPLAAAQDDSPPEEVGSTPGRGNTGPRTQVPVVVPVAGITPDDVAPVVDAVLALRHELYGCAACDLKRRQPGKCDRCSEGLTAGDPTEVVARAELQVDRRFLSVTLAPHHFGSLAELDGLLEPFEAKVKRADFRLPAFSRLRVTGVADEKAARRLRNGLVDLKVLPKATVLTDTEAQAAWLIPKLGEQSVTVGDIEAAIAKMRGELTIADVQWAAYCGECESQSPMELGAPTCTARRAATR